MDGWHINYLAMLHTYFNYSNWCRLVILLSTPSHFHRIGCTSTTTSGQVEPATLEVDKKVQTLLEFSRHWNFLTEFPPPGIALSTKLAKSWAKRRVKVHGVKIPISIPLIENVSGLKASSVKVIQEKHSLQKRSCPLLRQ